MSRYLLPFIIILSALPAMAKSGYDTLIYTHSRHELIYNVGKCDACHTNIMKSTKARDDNYTDQQLCNKTGCHDIKNQDSCFVCHTNPNGKTPLKPKREIKFNHKVHINDSIDCKTCHGYIDKTYYFDRKDMPIMSACVDCHEKDGARNDCEYCHTDPAIIMSHGMDDREGHGDLYKQAPQSCETCHINNFCDKCHQGTITEDVHPHNYLYIHQFDALGPANKCFVCHDAHQSCDACHQRSWGKVLNHQNLINGTQSCTTCHKGK